ncbi:Metal-dependent hydrolase YbeY, involved in rRNA and/or ribosome maturation and assembly [hydrothermal vent metagenome]|uniref:Metal-dependent hydrolase YbeY, involved in rRNA and/or ribosome maturation and assembly n=1 Tax=hydrothermal vent metagenome TaxID=652676 RepID=A0A1W1ECP9_9ZZZZ
MNLIDLDNQTKLDIDIYGLDNIAKSLTNRVIELIITSNEHIQKLNLDHREKDSPTDVLSFPIESFMSDDVSSTMPLGSIVISEDFVKEKAEEFNHSKNDELSLLFIHGLLHLLGYDHEVDSGKMREKEKETIEAFNLPKSLIVRTEEF